MRPAGGSLADGAVRRCTVVDDVLALVHDMLVLIDDALVLVDDDLL